MITRRRLTAFNGFLNKCCINVCNKSNGVARVSAAQDDLRFASPPHAQSRHFFVYTSLKFLTTFFETYIFCLSKNFSSLLWLIIPTLKRCFTTKNISYPWTFLIVTFSCTTDVVFCRPLKSAHHSLATPLNKRQLLWWLWILLLVYIDRLIFC